jgi:uncharacterized protein (UPF0212 family)
MSNHKCDVPDIDYSRVDRGHIHCNACGRDWHLATTTTDEGVTKIIGWRPDPKPTRGGSWS